MGKPRFEICTYCGARARVTDDHVPPRGLFPRDDWPALPTVPACKACNSGASLDDEYFRMALAMRDDVIEVPAAQDALGRTVRSLSMPEKRGLLRATLRSFDVRDKYVGEIFLGPRPAYHVDLRRLERVVQRIVRGLHRREYGEPLDPSSIVDIRHPNQMDGRDITALIAARRVAEMATSQIRRPVIEGAFEYAVARAADRPDATLWWLRFYGRVHFFALTIPMNLTATSEPGVTSRRS